MGVWLTTRHSAPWPHEPGQGSRHIWLRQASAEAQSLLTTHCGRQAGGAPTWPGKQAHDGDPAPATVHVEYGPHGDGTHGSRGGGGGSASTGRGAAECAQKRERGVRER